MSGGGLGPGRLDTRHRRQSESAGNYNWMGGGAFKALLSGLVPNTDFFYHVHATVMMDETVK